MATNAPDPTVILSYARTPMGAMQGALADASATDLGATAIRAAMGRALAEEIAAAIQEAADAIGAKGRI